MLTSAPIRRLLVVDDDPMVCELLSHLLSAEGFEVTAVQSGEAALATLQRGEHACDAVITDLQMPGTDGLELARHIRLLQPPPIVVGMSARAPRSEEQQVLDAFLNKPFTVEDLCLALDRAVECLESGREGEPRSFGNRATLPEKGSARSETLQADFMPSAPAETSPNSILNPEIFTKLRSTLGSMQLLQLYEMTANDVESRLGRMRASLYAGDRETVRQEAHAIKGGCAMVGATELSTLAGLAETGSETDSFHLQEMVEACIRLRRMVTIVPP